MNKRSRAISASSQVGAKVRLDIPLPLARRFKPDASDRGTSLQIFMSYVTALILLTLIAPATPWPRLAWGARAVGTGMALGGLGLRWWSTIVLGRFSGEAESTEAVISLMSQGRKRGYAGVIATQRLSKLHKDAAAEANNVIIGRTWLDADQARAGDALGLSKADRLKLRDVGQGEFYGFGPALGEPGVVRFHSDQVRTTHPRPGERHLLTPPAPSRAIRGVLGKFADLPHEAEDEIRGLDAARRRIAELERQVKHLEGASGAQQIDQVAVHRAVRSAVERERVAWQRKLEQGRRASAK
jgi:hypothetical protein